MPARTSSKPRLRRCGWRGRPASSSPARSLPPASLWISAPRESRQTVSTRTRSSGAEPHPSGTQIRHCQRSRRCGGHSNRPAAGAARNGRRPSLYWPDSPAKAAIFGRTVALDEQVRDEIRRSVFDSLPDGIVIVDLEGRITYANEQLARLSGYPAADLIGRKVEDLVPGAARGQHQRHRESYAAAGLPTRPMGTNLRIRLLTKGRTEVPVDISLRPLETGGGTRVLASIREAADQILSQERIEALLEVSQLILRGEAADEVLALIARRARHLVSADVAVVKVPSDDHSELAVQVADGVAEDELRGSRIPIEGSLAGEVFRSGRGRVVEDADSERLDADPLRKLGFGPSVVVP
ncbi:MAG: PAS domain S-box protein, partial [Chloroflexi bacterium]